MTGVNETELAGQIANLHCKRLAIENPLYKLDDFDDAELEGVTILTFVASHGNSIV